VRHDSNHAVLRGCPPQSIPLRCSPSSRLTGEWLTGGPHLVWSKNSCSLTLVVFQEASEPFTTLNGALTLAALAG